MNLGRGSPGFVRLQHPPCCSAAPRQPPPSPSPAVAAVAASVVTVRTRPCPHLPCRSVEMSVTPEYQVRPPMAPTHFFLIDVSQVGGAGGRAGEGCNRLTATADWLPCVLHCTFLHAAPRCEETTCGKARVLTSPALCLPGPPGRSRRWRPARRRPSAPPSLACWTSCLGVTARR